MIENTDNDIAHQESMGSSRVEYAYQKIKNNITRNVFPAGYQILEPDLATELGVSRTPAREALIRLEADGLVKLIPRRGMMVVPLAHKDIHNYIQVESALKKLGAQLLCEYRSDFDLTFLNAELAGLQVEHDNYAWLTRFNDIQMKWLAICENDLLQSQLHALVVRFERAMLQVLDLYEDKTDLNSSVAALVTALENKDEALAFNAIDAGSKAFVERFQAALYEHKIKEF